MRCSKVFMRLLERELKERQLGQELSPFLSFLVTAVNACNGWSATGNLELWDDLGNRKPFTELVEQGDELAFLMSPWCFHTKLILSVLPWISSTWRYHKLVIFLKQLLFCFHFRMQLALSMKLHVLLLNVYFNYETVQQVWLWFPFRFPNYIPDLDPLLNYYISPNFDREWVTSLGSTDCLKNIANKLFCNPVYRLWL